MPHQDKNDVRAICFIASLGMAFSAAASYGYSEYKEARDTYSPKALHFSVIDSDALSPDRTKLRVKLSDGAEVQLHVKFTNSAALAALNDLQSGSTCEMSEAQESKNPGYGIGILSCDRPK